MRKLTLAALICSLGLISAIPADPILRKLDPRLRYQHERDSSGQYHLVDLWMTLSDVSEATRYDPGRQNVYHLFTRENPTVSQPLLINNKELLAQTNFSRNRRTIILIHGWRNNASSDFVSILVHALLNAENVNVIVVDWSAGAGSINYPVTVTNCVTSGVAVAQFIDWLNSASGSNPIQYHIIGHGLGGHQAGIVARKVTGDIPYVTALDPSLVGWINHPDRFQKNDAIYTEVIHTNCGVNGYFAELAQVDFYPNGGESMPGCDTHACDHARSIFYFSESITSKGFTGKQCINYLSALLNVCFMPGRLNMGGLKPKIGSSGVYWLETNAAPPFSRG